MDDPAWSSLLPADRVEGEARPLGAARCVDHLPLGDSLRLAVYEDERGGTYPVPLVLSPGSVRRARPGEGASSSLVELLAGGTRRIGGFSITCWHAPQPGVGPPSRIERAITVDQTNESVVVGERAVVKWTLIADEGPHPGPWMLDALSRNGFAGMPRPWGAVQWLPPDGSPERLLALVVEYLPGAVDGWGWVVDDLRVAASHAHDSAARAAGAAVGRLVADFHRALAETVRHATRDEMCALQASAVADLDRALAVTTGATHDLLKAHASAVRAIFEAMPDDATPVMRVHGDLHVGQVLRTGTTYALTDFDGNPVVAAASRAQKQPAASDVAGMAQSFTHAGVVVREHNPDLDEAVVARMAAAARSTFLDTYRGGLGDRAAILDDRLLRPLAVRQVCREFTYAAIHLPRWSYVPEAALRQLFPGDGS